MKTPNEFFLVVWTLDDTGFTFNSSKKFCHSTNYLLFDTVDNLWNNKFKFYFNKKCFFSFPTFILSFWERLCTSIDSWTGLQKFYFLQVFGLWKTQIHPSTIWLICERTNYLSNYIFLGQKKKKIFSKHEDEEHVLPHNIYIKWVVLPAIAYSSIRTLSVWESIYLQTTNTKARLVSN